STAAPPAGQDPLAPGMPLVEVNGTEPAWVPGTAQALHAPSGQGPALGQFSPPPIKYVNIQIHPAAASLPVAEGEAPAGAVLPVPQPEPVQRAEPSASETPPGVPLFELPVLPAGTAR
ncbi:MAG: hypothetical protein WA904_10855, partial [Polaromonas sp.]